ncbi:MAG TPA: GNAT family N-acetyltransferase [Deltaproteobacteria bacterium]|jgi:acetyltransferase|nr:GNAT family N-acetyltransferase [Deltaproteobacteria bacterium]HOI06677.1 GNAT family N-acetyltransferase [Deltaproteobacteria bacterium]
MALDVSPPAYPLQYEGKLLLKDGREVLLRPIKASDGDLIVDLFARISPQSLYQRFLRDIRSLPEEMLHHFTHVDYMSEFALVAVVKEQGRDALVAVGRYARGRDDDPTDLGIAVRDDWQGLGLGKALLERTVSVAREHGITRFGSMMDPRNTAMARILKDLGYEVKYDLRGGFYSVEVRVPPESGETRGLNCEE